MAKNEKIYLAFDLGATSWRAALGQWVDGELQFHEIYRQANQPVQIGNGLFWNIEKIYQGMKRILKDLGSAGTKLSSIGIDSWSVDYALLDKRDQLLEPPHCYRDPRNHHRLETILKAVDAKTLFERTGLMFENITTLCQLSAAREYTPELLDQADSLLFIPDLLRFWLCGVKATDFTLATTSQLYNITKRQWDDELLSMLNLPRRILPAVLSAGTILGCLSDEIQKETQLGPVPVVTGASHDTAAAYSAVAKASDQVVLSSGTWSILCLPVDTMLPMDKIDPRRFGYEGNPDGSFRLSHGISGMYFIEQCLKSWARDGQAITYEQLIYDAEICHDFKSMIDPYADDFICPASMPEAIREYCKKYNLPVPRTCGEFARTIFISLADAYCRVIKELRLMTGRKLQNLMVVGGGTRNALLNELIAERAGVNVELGPAEASLTGNLINQRMATQKIL